MVYNEVLAELKQVGGVHTHFNHIRDDLDVIRTVIARATDELERLPKENEELKQRLSHNGNQR